MVCSWILPPISSFFFLYLRACASVCPSGQAATGSISLSGGFGGSILREELSGLDFEVLSPCAPILGCIRAGPNDRGEAEIGKPSEAFFGASPYLQQLGVIGLRGHSYSPVWRSPRFA